MTQPKSVESVLAAAQERGQRITPWQRWAMNAWVQRGIKPPYPRPGQVNEATYIELGIFPIPCDCVTCGQPSLIFPPEPGSPPGGYCICPCCSGQACTHKPQQAKASK